MLNIPVIIMCHKNCNTVPVLPMFFRFSKAILTFLWYEAIAQAIPMVELAIDADWWTTEINDGKFTILSYLF